MSLASGDLTTLARVKAWLDIDSDDSDSQLSRLITSASRFIYSQISLTSVAVQSYEENYDGYGQNFMLLKKWPALSITSVDFQGISLTEEATGNPKTNGYFLEPVDDINMGPQRLRIFGYRFPQGRNLVDVSYTAGFCIYDETYTVPAASEYIINLDNTWAGNIRVTYANGDALTEVASSPSAGEYTISNEGQYTFAAADADTVVLISYSYVPADLEQAAIELVAEGMRYRERIGIQSKSLGGQETVTYDNSSMTQRIRTLLQPFMRVAPI